MLGPAQHAVPREGGYVSLNYIRPLFDHLEQRGLPLAPVLEAIGLAPEQLLDVELYIDDLAAGRGFAMAEALTGDPALGLHLGQQMRPAHLGAFGHLLMSCTNAEELFRLHMRYAALIGDSFRPQYTFRPDEVEMQLVQRTDTVPPPRQVLEYCLAGSLSLMRWLAGPGLTPVLAELPYAEPVDWQEQREWFGCPVRFGAPRAMAVFGRDVLEMSFRNAYPGLRALLQAELDRRLPPSAAQADGWLHGVHHHLARLLPHGTPTLEALATQLGMQARSLQRAFSQRQTSFREALDEVRRQLAEQHVADSQLSLMEVSLLLGFAEQSVFQRAFRRWHGCTPGDYRRRRQAGRVATIN